MSKTRKTLKYRRPGKSLIATDRIQPQLWNLSEAEVIEALEAQGYEVKQIKKVSQLQHQICISYWDKQGNICSGFFSYRIFVRWQTEVEKLIYRAADLQELATLSHRLKYEFKNYPYPTQMEDTLCDQLETRQYELQLAGLTGRRY